MKTHTFRLLGLAVALPLALSACNSGTKAGDTNVERGSAKKMESNTEPSRTGDNSGDANGSKTSNGDSLAAGISRDTVHRPTGKQIFNSTDRAIDRNHDGIAD
ncbi:hypothetical protein GO988_05860 [Hymenobacter sp. HMF4947]|uniref:Uncharacterized protein n=1 Tax=Hymenobacter ginkgonis TaxID=2682976 RepID=A0A7K1TBR5_9BACT|nr:hypothetical protein [Hymenobacter ginkgonis]MVN75846.1 hypothetical protein [Hymenobacter ginkgonis]